MGLFKIKKAKADWTEAMLPKTRKELFFDVFKLHFFNFLYYGFFLLLLSFPMHLIAIISDLYESNLFASLNESSTEEQIKNIYTSVILFRDATALINIPLFCIFGIFFSGFVRVIRQYCYLENISFWHDYYVGLKQNWKQYLLLSFIVGILYALINIAINNSYLSVEPNILLIIFIGLTFIFAVPILSITSTLIPTYNNKFFDNIKLAVSIYFKSPFKVLGLIILLSLIYIPYFIPDFNVHLYGRLIATVLTPFIVLVFYLACLNLFDKSINTYKFPEAVGRGLYTGNKTIE